MKNGTLSALVRTHEAQRPWRPLPSWRQLFTLTLTSATVLALIVVPLSLLDPTAPLACIVIPALIGVCAPLVAARPGRFDVKSAHHALQWFTTVDRALVSMGYRACERSPACTRYRCRRPGLLRWREDPITLTLESNAIAIDGPMFALRALQRKLAA
jgi:hypothetical protein